MSLPTEKEAVSLKKYFVEYTVLVLLIAVVTLFGLYYNLNNFIQDTLIKDKMRMEQVIERNTDALTTFKK